MSKLRNKNFMKKTKKFLATLMVSALVVVSAVPTTQAEAAAKPKLNKKKVSIQVGKKYTLKVVNKIKGSKYTWKTNKKKVATVTKKGVVKGKKKGKAVITCTVKAPAKTYKLTANIRVKKAVSPVKPTPTPQVNTTATVSTQSELETALTNANIKTVLLKTEAEEKFTIPAGTYSTKTLTVNAPNADVTNGGVFKEINVQAIKDSTWTENAKGNTIYVSDTHASIAVQASAQVKAIIFSGINANVKVKAEGIISKLVFNKKAKVEVTGSAKEAIPVEVTDEAKDSEVISEVPVQIELSATATITLNKGAENSKVEKKTESVTVKVENKTTVTITITTPGGTVTVSAGSTITSEGKDSTTTATPAPSASSGSNNGGSTSDDTTPTTAPTTNPDPEPDDKTPKMSVKVDKAEDVTIDSTNNKITVSGEAVKVKMTIEVVNVTTGNITVSTGAGIELENNKDSKFSVEDTPKKEIVFIINSTKLAGDSKITISSDIEGLNSVIYTVEKKSDDGGNTPDGGGDNPDDGGDTSNVYQTEVDFTSIATSSAISEKIVKIASAGSIKVQLTVKGTINSASGNSIHLSGGAIRTIDPATIEVENSGEFTQIIKFDLDMNTLDTEKPIIELLLNEKDKDSKIAVIKFEKTS